MDKKLLQALDNLSKSLEMIADSLKSGEASSDTASALQSGDFVKQIQEINEGVKSIKADTQQILKNQQTIISLSKNKEASKKTEEFEGASDPKKESAIKKGVATILLIAVAVLAIGMAFKLVGDINILSVIGLALGITIVAIAFEKIAKLDLSIKQAAIASLTMVMMATAVTISSWILGLVTPVSLLKMLTATLIAAGFAIMGKSIAKLMLAFKGMSWGSLIKSVIFLPLVLPAIAAGIVLSSYVLGETKPITLLQWFSAILIASIFAVVSYGIRNMLRAFDKINPAEALTAAIFIPIILPAVALAIALASEVLGLVKPVGLLQWFTSILIGILFVVLSFGIAMIIKAFRGIDPATLLVAAVGIPIIFIAMSAAIWASSELLQNVVVISFGKFLTALAIAAVFVVLSYGIAKITRGISRMKWSSIPKIPVFFTIMSLAIMLSSHILSLAEPIEYDKLLKIAALGVALAAIAYALSFPMKVLAKLSMKDLLIGSLAIVILATTIMLTSLILSVGDYENYPGAGWLLGVGVGLIGFGLGAFALGAAVFGPQALVFLAGLAAILAVAGTIVLTDKIIGKGTYDKYPGAGWLLSVGTGLTGFGIGAVALGWAAILPPFWLGLVAIVSVADTILSVSKTLAKGKYDLSGFTEWTLATVLMYMTFTPMIFALGAMALGGAILSFFGADDPFESAKGMLVQIAQTIVAVSDILRKGTYKGGPTKEWAESVSIAMGAFMPIYGMMLKGALFSLFGGSDISPTAFSEAILTVTNGIVIAAERFSETSAEFQNPPPEAWAKGVGTAIAAFSPVFGVLMGEGQSWWSEPVTVEDMRRAIETIVQGIVAAAGEFAKNKAVFAEGYPSKKWATNVGKAVSAFSPVFEALSGKSWYQTSDGVIKGMAKGIRTVSQALVDAGFIFNKAKDLDWNAGIPTKKWGQSVSGAIQAFDGVFTYMNEGSGWFKSGASVASDLAHGIRVITGAIANAASTFQGKDWDSYPDATWSNGVRNSVQGMISLVTWVRNKFGGKDDSVSKAGKAMSGLRNKVLYELAASANVLYNNRRSFDPSIATKASSFTKTLSGVVHDFINLGMSVESRLVRMVKKTTEDEDFFGRKSKTTSYVKTERDMGIVDRVVSAMATTAKLVHKNRRYFNIKIDPNFVARLGKNIIDYTRLAEYLVKVQEKEKGWLDSIADAFGFSEDPVMKIARGMVYMAQAYDKLASAVDRFGLALSRINLDKVEAIKNLNTSQLANKIEKATPKSDEKEGGWFDKILSRGGESLSGVKGDDKKNKKNELEEYLHKYGKDGRTIPQQLDLLIDLLTSIDSSTNTIDEYIQLASDGKVENLSGTTLK